MKMKLIPCIILLLANYLCMAQGVTVQNERQLDLGLEDYILVENHLAVNPSDENHLLLSGMFVDANNPGIYGNFAVVSKDKGKTWQNLVRFDVPEGADPWGLITKDGIAVSTVLGLDKLYVFKSENGGEDWSDTPFIFDEPHDHQTLIQDGRKGIIYLVSIQGNKIYVNYSTDSGSTFTHPNRFDFSNLSANTMTPVLLQDGTLMVSFTTFNRPAINGSRNSGKAERLNKTLSWTIPFTIEGGFGRPLFISEECETGFPVLANNVEAEAFNDHMYYVCSSQTDKSVLFHYSNNNGRSWTAGMPVAEYTMEERSKRNPFTGIPQITVNKNGVIGMIWQGRTADDSGNCQYLYFSASKDGGKSFLEPIQVSSELSCMENEQNDWAGQRYKSGGDYTGFVSDENGDFIVIWPDSRNGISKLYMANIRLED